MSSPPIAIVLWNASCTRRSESFVQTVTSFSRIFATRSTSRHCASSSCSAVLPYSTRRGSPSMCWRLYSAIIRGNWHLFIKRLQEYWRSRCKSSRRRKEQERMKHFGRESVTTTVFFSRNQGGSMFEKQRSIIAPPPGDHKGLYL